ncbi:MAG: hypothetical protein GC168_16805 [Candidatus Hydrogenedens sp.]|nr:hypothetical protein [Candidatus Hydrogenedens sp.]
MFGKKKTETKRPVGQADIDACLAKAVAQGDMVNLKFAFTPNSPLRDESPEVLDTAKYAYLRPSDADRGGAYDQALALVSRPEIQQHHVTQLKAKRPAQLHADVVMALADNAVRLEKFTVAAQAYEMLRIRERMREEYAAQAEAALDQGDLNTAVRGFRIATGLSYDYAAFPEPMPLVPNYQSRALMLHAIYPKRPEDSIALLPPERQIPAALNYLLLDPELAARLREKPADVLVNFIAEYVRQRDPQWDEFVKRYREACEIVRDIGEKMKGIADQKQEQGAKLREEIALQELGVDPKEVPAKLLGRSIEPGDWWQYLKDLVYQHPASVLFVTRQMVTRDIEIVMPRFYQNAPLGRALGLFD